ncbi:hypothetical protein Ocin01_12695 [Orchesella cincta]|uniref:Phospholipid scramblase n=1 Tax=Orchesella cincta TaxID=48709 RepID=A0A1D2MLR1_ORCCI|nr:hypothetical protein Ocin01_12695 [Orchesella cincta]
MEINYEVDPTHIFLKRKQRIFGVKRYFASPKFFRKVQPVCSSTDTIRCVPACDMKFSGLGSSRPRHCPKSQIQHLTKILHLLKTTSVDVRDADVGWSLRGDTHQILSNSAGLQIFQSSIIPLGNLQQRISQLFGRYNPGFKVLVRDETGSTVMSMICRGSSPNDVCEVDEMEVFLAKCKLSIGKVVKLPSVFKKYVVLDEKGDCVYHIQILASFRVKSCIVTTYQIFHLQLNERVGIIKCSKRTWARFVPECCLGFGPYGISFGKELPLTHKALLLGALLYISKRTTWKTEDFKELPGTS